MADREKVIATIHYCTKEYADPGEDECNPSKCPYAVYQNSYDYDCKEMLLKDALALLEEREPVVTVNAYGKKFYKCANCGLDFEMYFSSPRKVKFCSKCGQAVKWSE